MTISRNTLCAAYALMALLALIGTWGNVFPLVLELGFWQGTLRFWQDVLVNESSRFITIDALFLGLAIVLWMMLEARRLKIPGVWLYVAGGLLIAISVAVPLFMIHRERRLAALEPGSAAGQLVTGELFALLLMTLAFSAYGWVALNR